MDENVYGQNQPVTEESTGEHLERVREESKEGAEGGMGRDHTPKDGESQGQWGDPPGEEQEDSERDS